MTHMTLLDMFQGNQDHLSELVCCVQRNLNLNIAVSFEVTRKELASLSIVCANIYSILTILLWPNS